MLTTPRLLLRPQETADAEVFHQLWSERDPRVPGHRRLDEQGRPTVEDIAEDIRQSGSTSLLLSAVLRESSELIGYAGLIFSGKGAENEPEIAFELLQRTHGNGYATEAGEAVLAWARELGHRRLWASVWDWNIASLRVLEKLGFRDAGVQHPAMEHGRTILTVREL
ncbi:ribosomal-protein-alanine N-acetyltransferase [Microbacterium sp. W4I4]|uniref:GNAT family N-acetyltransferase n=1 Tax=Microbacterium sp. W4I4 TaxID=3042295 RepID=UPI002784DC80|nr:GNAT family N-acetyltransferase [Microbacterium sp. W4I4]MDQ0612875.1 ribosomal-protein-alanine N-acetyltransferase [Microbacterium sp. W4I4]